MSFYGYLNRRKRLWVCEECGSKTETLVLSKKGKHVCSNCDYLIRKYNFIGKNIKSKSLF